MIRPVTLLLSLLLVLLTSVLAAGTQADAEAALAAGLEDMRAADSGEAGDGTIVDAAIKLLQARDIYQELGFDDSVREVNSYLFWCRKKMTNSELDLYLAAIKKEDPGKAATAKRAMDEATKTVEQKVSKSDAEIYFESAKDFAKAHGDDLFRVGVRYLEVAERFAEIDPKVAIEANRLSSEAFKQWSAAESERIKTERAKLDKEREKIKDVAAIAKRLGIDEIFVNTPKATGDIAVPDRRDLGKAKREMKDLYERQLGSEDKQGLAVFLAKEARKSKNDPALAYVLATEAIEEASDRKVNDVHTVLATIGWLAKAFKDVDVEALKADAFKSMNYKIGNAAVALQEDPENPEANTWIGMVTAFSTDNMKGAIPMLSRSHLELIKRAGRMEAAAPKQADEQLQLAEAWYEIADETDYRDMRLPIKRRALHWYEAALDGSEGSVKRKVAERVEELQAEVPLRPQDVDFKKLTAKQFDRLLGYPVVVDALKGAKTDIVLGPGHKVRIVPHPEDKWGVGYDLSELRMCDWRGTSAVYTYGGADRAKLGSLVVYMGSEEKLVDPGVIEGPGEIILGMYRGDRGSDTWRYYGSNARGKIRVKIVLVSDGL